jgi:hypothetical protein
MISRLLAIFAAFFLLSFAAGASAAAITCADAPLSVSPASSTMDDCADHHSKKAGSALACTPMCAAVAPQIASVAAPRPAASSALPRPQTELPDRSRQPDPPPPRG